MAFREPPSTGEVAQTPVEKPIGQKQLITSSFRKRKKNLYVCITSLEKAFQGFLFCVFLSCVLTATILAEVAQ